MSARNGSPAPGAPPSTAVAAPPAPPAPLLLAGDAGGTKTVLALVTPGGEVVAEEVYPSRAFATLEDAIARFRAAHPAHVRRVALSVAGPVLRGQARVTNLPWLLDAEGMARTLEVDEVRLVNDLQATAAALPYLSPGQIRTLHPGVPDASGPCAVLAIGTGMGESMLLPSDGGYRVVPGEGGHCDFAPRDAVQRGLLAFLQREHDHVSYERVLSGAGIVNIYRYLRQHSGVAEPAWLSAAIARHGDAAPAIVEGAMGPGERCPVCRRTLRVFAAILGAEAGNLGLRTLATGGVYLGGGIPPRLVPALRGRAFLQGFLRKGPMSSVMARIPVHVVMEPRAALLGAARYGMAPA